VVPGFVESILRDGIGLSIVKYTLRIIIAQNGFKCVLVVCLKLQFQQVEKGIKKNGFSAVFPVIVFS